MNEQGGVATVTRQRLWTAMALRSRQLPRVFDEPSLDEKEQRLANAILAAVRKEMSGLDRKIDAATSKYEQVLATIDENLQQLERDVEGGEGEGDEEEKERTPRSQGRRRAVADDDDGEGDEDTPNVPEGDLSDDVKKIIAFERRRNEKRIRKLEEQVADRDKKAIDAERKARDASVSRLLSNAVAAANAADPRAAVQLLQMNKVRWDDEKGHAIYTTSEGAEFSMTEDNYESFADAVKDDMPDWMRRAAAGSGGSGATPAKAADRLDMAKRELAALEKQAEGNDDHAIARMHAKRREIQGLEQDVEKVTRR